MKVELGRLVNGKGQTVKVTVSVQSCPTCGTPKAEKSVIVSWGTVIDCVFTPEESRQVSTLLREAADEAETQ